LGIHLKGPGFKRCNNHCVFCFIDQNPGGVRRPLRFKDEDFCLSFLYGNYVTLTNTPREDLDRIIEQRLAPIYVSVHATEPELRRELLGNPKAPDILPIMQYLADGEIIQHAQVVLMPGKNDGEHLDRTVDDLTELYPWVGSICIVPVGVTKHRAKLPELRVHTAEEARALLRWQEQRQERFLGELSERFVYISDEFYLVAGEPIPEMEFYEGFPQVGNGVGMIRQFMDAFEDGLPRLTKRFTDDVNPLRIDLVTATLPARFLLDMIHRVHEVAPGIAITPHAVTNEWYGEGITVSGLLSGRDIVAAVRERGRGEVVLLPPNCLNDDMLFLDDLHAEDAQEQIGKPVVFGTYDLIESIELAYDRVHSAGANSGLLDISRGPARDEAESDDDAPETMRAV
ncbi:MAG TPA: DUF512 domain-containing protein, partial [Firmicutes bacterium]|nr:DUF512 domain-containing protein [Bacillota bacterium]